ncbi:MAG: beta-propeller domain-containing protein, partial [Ornithinimicrobium sp.]
DVADPQRTDQLTWPGGYSPVEWDHRAFTLWPETGQFFVPAEIFNGTPEDFSGVVTGGFDGQRLTQGVLLPTSDSGPAWGAPAERTIVIEEEVWTVHPEGLNRYDLDTLDGGPAISW